MTVISVSSYSLREQLGPISIDYVDADGADQAFVQDFPQLVHISDFPGLAARAYPVTGVETVAFQYAGIDDPAIDAFARDAARAGLSLVNAAVDAGDLLQPDPERLAADVATLKRWIARFAQVGFERVRVNPGSPFGSPHGDVPPAHLIEALVELGDDASRHGVRLLVENHGGPSSDPIWMNNLLDGVGVDHVGLLLDLGNFDALLTPLMATLFAEPDARPADPFADLDLSSLYDGIEALAGRAELVHVKAHRVDDDGAVGPIDLARALGLLERHGYRGPLTIEYEGSGGDPWARTGRVIDVTAATANH